MQCSVHSKSRGPNIEPCWLLQVHSLQRSNLTLKCDIIFYNTPTFASVIIIKYMAARFLMEDIFKIAVIYRSTNETRMLVLSALEYKDGAQNIFNCSCTQKRCLARSLSTVPHGQRVWLSDKPAWLRRGILCFFFPPSLLSFSLYHFNPFLFLWRALSHFLSFIFKSPHHISYSKCRSDESMICSLSLSLFLQSQLSVVIYFYIPLLILPDWKTAAHKTWKAQRLH